MMSVPQAIRRSNYLQKIQEYFIGIYTYSRSITKQVAKNVNIGYLAKLDHYSLAHLKKIQEHLDVFYFTQRILDQDSVGKYQRASRCNLS